MKSRSSGERDVDQVQQPGNLPRRYPNGDERAHVFNDESPMQSGATQRNLQEDGYHLPTHEPGWNNVEPCRGRK